jgi:mandelamide amidase
MSEPGDLSRRTFVLGASATAAMNAVPMSFAGVPPDESTSLSAVDAVARMTRGDITVEGYASALLARCEALRSLNAFITLEPSRVLEVARACDRQRQSGTKLGPLFGLPIPIKDSVNTEDYPTTAGTEALRNFRPTADAPLVRRLRAAGAIVLGKTNLHEMSFGWTSNNLPFGAVHNPYDPTRIPGGSSGGTAAAVAARMAPLGIAEDTAGSIRVPAALCGISGFRPTTGRYSTQGVVPLTPVFDQVGPHARTVSDLGLFDSVIANDWRPLRPTPLKGLRLGIVRAYYFNGLHPEVERVTNLALQRIKEAGGELVETEFPDLVEESINLIRDQMISHDEIPTLTQYLKESGAHVTVDDVV